LRPLSGARLKRCAATLIQAKIGRISGEKNRIMDDELARALATLTTGIYVLTVAVGVHRHGMSSSWVTQVSGVPALFSAAVDNQHLSRSLITRTATLGLNIVGRRGKALEDYFYSPQAKREDNLDGLDYELSPILHVPWLKAAMAWIEAEVKHSFVVGDHTLFVAEPVGLRLGAGDRPLTSLDLDYVYVGGKKVIPRDRSGW
jgi:flavin reductase (DIM6/NTAB) family NADH-FMN oxidoreductase RutF